MSADLGSRDKSQASSLKWENVLVRKAKNLSFLAQIFWVIAIKRLGGQIDTPPQPNRVKTTNH